MAPHSASSRTAMAGVARLPKWLWRNRCHWTAIVLIVPALLLPYHLVPPGAMPDQPGVSGAVGPWTFTLWAVDTEPPHPGEHDIPEKEYAVRFGPGDAATIRQARLLVKATPPTDADAGAGAPLHGSPHAPEAHVPVPPDGRTLWLWVEGWSGVTATAAIPLTEGARPVLP